MWISPAQGSPLGWLANGAIAQLVEHLPGRQGVRGSSPLSSTVMKEGGVTYRVAVVGPESSGKTNAIGEMAQELGRHGIKVAVVAEAGRVYAQDLPLDHIWTMADELAVARLHLELMAEVATDADLALSDGAVITPRVWSLRAFGVELPELVQIDDTATFDAIALTAPDLPWRPDPLRTVAANREVDFALYQRLLSEVDRPIINLVGAGPGRVAPLRAHLKQAFDTASLVIKQGG